jgi:hypothetical protein
MASADATGTATGGGLHPTGHRRPAPGIGRVSSRHRTPIPGWTARTRSGPAASSARLRATIRIRPRPAAAGLLPSADQPPSIRALASTWHRVRIRSGRLRPGLATPARCRRTVTLLGPCASTARPHRHRHRRRHPSTTICPGRCASTTRHPDRCSSTARRPGRCLRMAHRPGLRASTARHPRGRLSTTTHQGRCLSTMGR